MNFEFTGIISFDVDEIFEMCCDDNRIDTDEIHEAVEYWMNETCDPTYEFVEDWMIDKVVTEIKKRIDKVLED